MRSWYRFLFPVLVLVEGCSQEGAPSPSITSPPPREFRVGSSAPTYAVVRVFYATDRNLTLSTNASERYGSERGGMDYGTCDVSIPRDHRLGELEAPSIWKLEFRKNPEKHVVLLEVARQEKAAYFSQLAARIGATRRRNAFIFVHGYNVTFEDAARRTAQMSYDLGFDGAPVFYSWPSQGTLAGYPVDESNIEWTQTHLQGFLNDVLSQTGATNLYLIAHSMGNRALTRAFASLLAEVPDGGRRIREVILAAPDIDADVFKRDIAPQIATADTLVTLYASAADKALLASKEFHGYPRAGDAGAGLILAPPIQTIDATAVDTSLLGHSYFAEDPSVLGDLFYLIREGKSADERFSLDPVDTASGRYWIFKK